MRIFPDVVKLGRDRSRWISGERVGLGLCTVGSWWGIAGAAIGG